MNYAQKIYNKLRKKKSSRPLSSIDSYKLWSTSYDNQPDNAVLFLENKLFSELLSQTDLENKIVLDIGCGTGRHWQELLKQKPSRLIGIDNSKEMIDKLKKKFSDAEVYVSNNNSLNNFKNYSIDFIISTLTIGHISDIEKFFEDWNRVLRLNGEIIITDFHPEAFRMGMKRTFSFKNEVIEVENYFYSLGFLKRIFEKLGWEIISIYEKVIDKEVKHLFQKQNYLGVYNKYKGTPLILGLQIKKR